ncbi:MAG: NUDIX hydrolase [Kiritimatiellia bacterium]
MNERTLNSREIFSGRLLKMEVQEVETASGAKTRREIVRHPGAVAVLASLPDGRFVFVRQYRKPVDSTLVEAVAGTLDPGEDAQTCARRELAEETGLAAGDLTNLGALKTAPGYTDEVIHIFHTEADEEGRGPAPDEDEELETVVLTEAEVEEMITDGRISDAKTVAAWLLYRKIIKKQPELSG